MCKILSYDEMEMPTPCVNCGEWFDLNDGYGSTKWHPNITICDACHDEEEKEIEKDEEIEELLESIEDAEITIKDARTRLFELGYDIGTRITIKQN